MGLLTTIRKQKLKDKEVRILMLGLDNAGKSTIVQSLLDQDTSKVVPTMGFEINTLELEGHQLNIWDIGGQQTLRSFWFNYFDKLDSLIWVIDLANLQRLSENFKEFHDILSNEKLIGVKVLILLNKMDLVAPEQVENCKSTVIATLELEELAQNRWMVQECSAYDVKSVQNGLNWLVS